MKPLLLAALLLAPLSAGAESYPDARRIVTIGGPVTEIVFALGAGERIVARDTTSIWPDEVGELPDIGYMRRLSAEGVLSVGPDLIIMRDTAGPPDALDQLRAAAVPIVEIHDAFTPQAVVAAIRQVGEAIDSREQAADLADRVEADLVALADEASRGTRPRVMFVLSNQGGRLNVAGRGTGADGIIALAGGENVMARDYEGYKIMSDEAVIAAAPEVIVMIQPTGAGPIDNGREDVMELPAIQQTPAGEAGALVLVNGAALGFGPRTAEFARKLMTDLRGAGGG
ncbi:MAG: hemin ABC transporter substrate-binding protein [Pseudorhodobacter sp.]